MKALKLRHRLLIAITALFAAAILPMLFITETVYASGHSDGDSESYSYVIDNFTAVYDIDESGYMDVTEVLTITYTGAKSYSVTRTLASDDNDRVRNITVSELEGDEYEKAEFSIDTESSVIIIEIGDEDSKTNETHVYRLCYGYYCHDQAEREINIYPFNGIEAEISLAEITLNLPYTSKAVFTLNGSQAASYKGDKITCTLQDVQKESSLCVDITVGGIISGYTDLSGYYALIILAVLAIALVVVKLVFFNKHKLKKDILRDVPYGYDPLLVGKLVDNSVSDSDVASLIFHWAAKGYVKIDLKNPEKPVITKTANLPAIAPDYQQMLFYKLFKHTNVVYTDELDDDFYKTTEAVKKAVDKKASGSYTSTSIGISVLFGVLAAFVMGGAPTIFAIAEISVQYAYITGLIFAIPPLIIYGLCETLMYNRFKLKPKVFWGYMAGIIALCAACTVIYVFVVPSNIMETVPKILVCVIGYAVAIASTFLIARTETYNSQLGAILGFRKFIKTAGHTELREMATKDSQLFYEIYPYAQVLNLEKEWTDKFYSMNIKPPAWCVNTGAAGSVSATIAADMKTARIKISTAISTAPAAKKRKKNS
ncbi:MAG: DUF2207 domain-containing protein [Clostridia bacterium]|nr:DUF2207 domain-containing protein [Clostridia bacterium]